MFLDPNNENQFVIQWIREAKEAIQPRLKSAKRNNKAYQFEPEKNTYKIAAKNLNKKQAMKMNISTDDWERIICGVDAIPDGYSDVVFNAVETNVNQLAGGIGSYEYTILDKSAKLEPNLEELLELTAARVYNLYGLDRIKDVSFREIMLNSATYFYTFYDEQKKDVDVQLLNISEMILDPIRFRRGKARFIGFHKMISWNDLEKEVNFKEDFLDVKNGVKIYAKNIQDLMNNTNLALSPEDAQTLKADITNIYTDHKYTSNATNNEAKLKQKYQGEDVEIAYVWDLTTGDKYSVVNRRFIIDIDKNALDVDVTIEDELRSITTSHSMTKRLQSPIIEIPYIINPNIAYTITPLDYHQETFDEICSMESLKKHNESIAGTLTPVGSPYDLSILALAGNVSGRGVEGMDGTVAFLNKQYDPTFMDSRIQQREAKIQKSMNAYSQIDMQVQLGDRASAKEAGQASNAVAAGHNSLVHNIETGFAEILRNINLLIVKYKVDKVIKVRTDDQMPTVNIEYLALDAVLNVRLKSEVERSRQQNSLIASQLINVGANNPYINQEKFIPRMLEITFGGLLSRSELQEMVMKPENQDAIAAARSQAEANAAQVRLEQQVVSENPMGAIASRMANQMTPDDMDTFTLDLETGNMPVDNQALMAQGQQDPIPQTGIQQNPNVDINGDLNPDTTGMPPEIAGEIANGGTLDA